MLGVTTFIIAMIISKFIRSYTPGEKGGEPFAKALLSLIRYSLVFLIAIMAIYFLTNSLGLSDVAISFTLTGLVLLLIVFIYKNKAREVKPVLKNPNLILIYLSAIPILWHLWFYGFWSVAIVKDFGGGALTSAALVASFNAAAGLIGFPIGGRISDHMAHKPMVDAMF
ncbi:hypothetical protein JCM15765_39100 [Paradesulfitobacterium aromaticivorans]